MRTFAHVDDPMTLTDEERKRWEYTCPRETTPEDETRDINCSPYQSNINNQRRK